MSKTYDEASLPCKATSTYWERTLILHAIDTNGAGLKGRTYTATFSMLGNVSCFIVLFLGKSLQINFAFIYEDPGSRCDVCYCHHTVSTVRY